MMPIDKLLQGFATLLVYSAAQAIEIPTGEVQPTESKSDPKGWVECSKTHAAKQCEERGKVYMRDHPDAKEEPRYIIKLPASGKVSDLDKFLDAAAASLEGRPK